MRKKLWFNSFCRQMHETFFIFPNTLSALRSMQKKRCNSNRTALSFQIAFLRSFVEIRSLLFLIFQKRRTSSAFDSANIKKYRTASYNSTTCILFDSGTEFAGIQSAEGNLKHHSDSYKAKRSEKLHTKCRAKLKKCDQAKSVRTFLVDKKVIC